MSNATVSDQLQHMWRTRPYRLPQRGHIAGVAAGIGYRYGIDPVLVRVALVVGTIFGGAGIVLYLAAWLLFSKAGDTASPAESLIGKGGSSDSTTKVVVLIVALVIVVSTIGPVGVGMGGSGLISMVALLAGWWLLYQRRPEPPEFLPDGAQAYLQQGFPISFNSPYGPNVGVPNSPWAGANYRPPNYDATRLPYTPYTTLPSNYVPNPSPAAPPEESTSVNLTKDTGESAIPDQPTPPVLGSARGRTIRLGPAGTGVGAGTRGGGEEAPITVDDEFHRTGTGGRGRDGGYRVRLGFDVADARAYRRGSSRRRRSRTHPRCVPTQGVRVARGNRAPAGVRGPRLDRGADFDRRRQLG